MNIQIPCSFSYNVTQTGCKPLSISDPPASAFSVPENTRAYNTYWIPCPLNRVRVSMKSHAEVFVILPRMVSIKHFLFSMLKLIFLSWCFNNFKINVSIMVWHCTFFLLNITTKGKSFYILH